MRIEPITFGSTDRCSTKRAPRGFALTARCRECGIYPFQVRRLGDLGGAQAVQPGALKPFDRFESDQALSFFNACVTVQNPAESVFLHGPVTIEARRLADR